MESLKKPTTWQQYILDSPLRWMGYPDELIKLFHDSGKASENSSLPDLFDETSLAENWSEPYVVRYDQMLQTGEWHQSSAM